MNPVIASMIGTLVRFGFTFVSGYLVAKGVWTPAEAATYTTAVVLGGTALIWALWEKYVKNRLINTALALPQGSTRVEAQKVIDAGYAPPAGVKENHAPFLQTQNNPRKEK
jgi:hypothetical protein